MHSREQVEKKTNHSSSVANATLAFMLALSGQRDVSAGLVYKYECRFKRWGSERVGQAERIAQAELDRHGLTQCLSRGS